MGGNSKAIPLPPQYAGFEHFGYSVEIEQSGKDFFAHKTGFTHKSLTAALMASSFSMAYSRVGNLEINAVAFKGTPDAATKALFGLPED